MDRRAQGGLVLVLALVAVLTGSQLINPALVTGTAAVQPPPGAPTVGTCLATGVTSSWGAAGVLQPSDTTYVECDRPHRAEIVLVIDPLPVDASSGTVFQRCAGSVDVPAYLGRPGGDWRPALQMRTTASGPDARQVASGQNWAACVLVDDVGPALTVPLAGAAAAHALPPQVGVCFDGTAADLAFRGTTSCDTTHGGELFGTRPVGADADLPELTASCRELVAADTGRPALVTDPALSVSAVVSDDVATDPTTGVVPDGATGTARCVVLTLDGHRLTASLRGVGDGSLPWAD